MMRAVLSISPPMALCAILGSAAFAAIGDEGDGPRPFEAECTIVDTCRIEGGCADLPAPGELLLRFDGTDTSLGQSEADLAPIDRYADIEAVHPLAPIDTRRSLLVDLPPEGPARRFALFVQPATPNGADPILQRRYFVMSCWDIPQ